MGLRLLWLVALAGCAGAADKGSGHLDSSFDPNSRVDTESADADSDGYNIDQDCDDGQAEVHPGATELCDGQDNDCDGVSDEGGAADASTWYADLDADAYGDPTTTTTACTQPEDFLDVAGDCDDNESEVHPGSTESCDGIDNDCDTEIDEDDADNAPIWYVDLDADGYGDPFTTRSACAQPDGAIAVAGDCDDTDGTVYPGAEEICDDGSVNDCDSDRATAMDACGPGFALSLGSADLKLIGEGGSDLAGTAVSGACDIDGDGLDDVLIGAHYEDSAGSDAGAAYLLLGGGTLAAAADTLNLSGADLKLSGGAAGDHAGYALAAAKDIDGDGYGDLLVGATHEDSGGSRAGAAYLVLGGGTMGSISLRSADLKLTGETAGDELGFSLSSAGDIDGDGLGDLLLGADREDSGGTDAGAAYLVLASTVAVADSGTEDLAEADLKLTGQASEDAAGTSVSGAGDVDGDGLHDLVVGAFDEGSGGSHAGAAYLLLGGGSLHGVTGALSLESSDLKLIGEDNADFAGAAVSGAGDVDGDGWDDLLVAAWGEDTADWNAGAIYLLLGRGARTTHSVEMTLTDADLKLLGEAEDDQAGSSVSGAGDFDADGRDDLLIGACYEDSGSYNAGAAYLLLASSAVDAISGALSLSEAELKLTGEADDDNAGVSVSEAGDVNTDGFADLLVGANYEDSGGLYAGAAYLVFGGGP